MNDRSQGIVGPAKWQIARAGLDTSTKQRTETIREIEKLIAVDILLSANEKETKREEAIWRATFAQSITKALKQPEYTPVKIVGWIADITEPLSIALTFGERTEAVKGLRITITDNDGGFLESLTAPVEGYQTDLYALKAENRRVVFCGTIVPILRANKPENRFFLWDIIPSWNAEDLIAVDISVNAEPIHKIFTREAKKEHGIFAYIKRTLVSELSITGLAKLPELGKCIDATIYQALSDGMNASPRYSNRIHTLVIGPPGQGKGFLTDIGRILNPVSAGASTVGGKISAAGLVGTVTKRFGRSMSLPGYLPLTSGGVLAFQDFHQLRNTRSTVHAIISEAMQDGTARDSTSARTTHEAVTAIHVDMNRSSQVEGNVRVDAYSDLGIPYNVISRFDFICELPADLERSLASLKKRFKGKKTLSSYPQDALEAVWQRQLQRLVAYMRTYWRTVEIPEDVNQYILERVRAGFGFDSGSSGRMNEKFIQDNINRVSNSVLKFVKAIACADHNPTAAREDVDRAFEYVGEKLKFLAAIKLNDTDSFQDPRTLKVKERLSELLTQIRKPTFRTADYVELLGPFVDEKQRKSARQAATRDLNRLLKEGKIAKSGQGSWRNLSERQVHPKKASSSKDAMNRPVSRLSKGPKVRKR